MKERLFARDWYGEDGFYQGIVYYPDGTPWCVTTGKYEFSERGFVRSRAVSARFDAVGRLLPLKDGPDGPNGMREELCFRGGSSSLPGAHVALDWSFRISVDSSFVFHVFLSKEETFVRPGGVSYGGATEVVGKFQTDGYLDFQNQQVTIENTFNVAQKSSAKIRIPAAPNADRRSVVIVFVSEGDHPCTETFRFDRIPAKRKP